MPTAEHRVGQLAGGTGRLGRALRPRHAPREPTSRPLRRPGPVPARATEWRQRAQWAGSKAAARAAARRTWDEHEELRRRTRARAGERTCRASTGQSTERSDSKSERGEEEAGREAAAPPAWPSSGRRDAPAGPRAPAAPRALARPRAARPWQLHRLEGLCRGRRRTGGTAPAGRRPCLRKAYPPRPSPAMASASAWPGADIARQRQLREQQRNHHKEYGAQAEWTTTTGHAMQSVASCELVEPGWWLLLR